MTHSQTSPTVFTELFTCPERLSWASLGSPPSLVLYVADTLQSCRGNEQQIFYFFFLLEEKKKKAFSLKPTASLQRPDGSFLLSPLRFPCFLHPLLFIDLIYGFCWLSLIESAALFPPSWGHPKQKRGESDEETDDNVKHSHCDRARSRWLDSVSRAPAVFSPTIYLCLPISLGRERPDLGEKNP